jgi:hypothetical protein
MIRRKRRRIRLNFLIRRSNMKCPACKRDFSPKPSIANVTETYFDGQDLTVEIVEFCDGCSAQVTIICKSELTTFKERRKNETNNNL